MDSLAAEAARGRGPLCEAPLPELAGRERRGVEEPAAELGPDLAKEPAAELGPDLALCTPLRCTNGGIEPQKKITR